MIEPKYFFLYLKGHKTKPYLLLLLLITAIELSLGGSSADESNKNKYTEKKQYKNTVRTIINSVNANIHITKTLLQLSKHPHIQSPTHYKTHTYTQPHITKQVKTTAVQDTHQMK